MATYRNPWFRAVSGCDPEVYETDATPVELHGFLIYQRLRGVCWDVVKDGTCVAQRAGMRGAIEAVERIVNASRKHRSMTTEQMIGAARGFP